MNLKGTAAPVGHFCIQKHNRKGELTFETNFQNIVLDVGWSNLAENPTWTGYDGVPGYLFLGTGTSEPQQSDTGLEQVSSSLAGKYRSSVYLGEDSSVADKYAACVVRVNYEAGEAEGIWSELGLAFDANYDKPYNRSLIRDENGNPITITILADEYLTIYVTLGIYFGLGEVTSGAVDYNGESHGWSLEILTNYLFDRSSDGFPDNFWQVGFNNAIRYRDSEDVLYDLTPQHLTYLGDFSWESSPFTHQPGSRRSIQEIIFVKTYTTYGTRFNKHHVAVKFDTPIIIPADHQLTIDKHTIQWTRGSLPA